VAVTAGVAWDAEGAEALSAECVLAEALEANRRLSELAEGLTGENALLREGVARLAARDAERDAELEKLRADLAVLQRMLFGRSSEKSRPGPPGDGDAVGEGGGGRERGSGTGKERGPGARAGRRDYSRLPRFEVFWDFPGGGYCCPCDTRSHVVSELVEEVWRMPGT
jgi:transposase